MTESTAPGVLHITSAAGGGVDRNIRDLASSSQRAHYVLHVGDSVDVLEDPTAHRFTPLRDLSANGHSPAVARWLDAAGIGIAHLHGVDASCRKRFDALTRAHALPYVVTLHDLNFVNPNAFDASGMPEPDPGWIAQVAPFLERSATVIAPSQFILDVALACARGLRSAVIAPGIRMPDAASIPEAPADFAERRPAHVVAVVGAIGPHKGSRVLEDLAAALVGSGIALVVIGYLDTQLTRGWILPGSLYIHGPYDEASLGGWLAAYRVETVVFPNRLPESFSYTLSEVWAAGVPVVVPDDGALGERVAAHSGGWRLPAGFDGDDAAALLVWLSSTEGADELGRVKSRIQPTDARRVPTIDTMSREIDALYARYAAPSGAADGDAARDALSPLLAANLDGFAFRKELVNLTSELEHVRTQLVASQEWTAKVERDSAAWAAKLETDIAALKTEIERLGIANRDLAEHKIVVDHLPKFVREYLLKRVRRARG